MDHVRFQLAEILRPIHSWAPRGYGFLYQKILGSYYANYPADPELKKTLGCRHRIIHDKYLGAYVCVDLGDWAGRAHYFKGIYYDRTVPLLIDSLLAKNGGTFIDIGANRGLHTLYAARVLGNLGTVYAFEPNPETFDVLKTHLSMNHIRNCFSWQVGLSDSKMELNLNLFSDDHSGTCSFVTSGEVAGTVTVPVHRFDDIVDSADLKGPLLVKIDVEGFEHNVLKGMRNLLARKDVTIVCELTDDWLRQTGSSVSTLMAEMKALGYTSLLPTIEYRHLFKEVLTLKPLNSSFEERQFDAVFLRQ